jgi:hypothetical protein
MKNAAGTMLDTLTTSEALGIFNILPIPGMQTDIDADRAAE